MIRQIINRLFVAYFQIPWIKNRWAKKFQALNFDAIPWTPLTKKLSDCKIAIVTTAGVHLKNDKPFDMQDTDGDASYRAIPSESSFEDLMITHNYYDHKDADKDMNIVFPLEILRKFQTLGKIGASAKEFFSFMGHIQGRHVEKLMNSTAKEIALKLRAEGVDVAFLTPA